MSSDHAGYSSKTYYRSFKRTNIAKNKETKYENAAYQGEITEKDRYVIQYIVE